MRVAAVAIGALVLAAPLAALADDIPPCPAPAGVLVATLDNGKAPAVLIQAIRQIGPMARPGQPFNATDVVTAGYPGRRFILLWGSGPRWVLAYEQGGIAYNDPAILFSVSGGRVTKLAEQDAIPRTICATVHKLIGK